MRAVIQIAHGMGEHTGRHVGTIEALVSFTQAITAVTAAPPPTAAHLGDFGSGGFDLLWRTCFG